MDWRSSKKDKKDKKKTNVQVDALTVVHDFTISSSTTGTQLFHQVALLVGLKQLWPFGLCYTDKKKFHAWLNLKKKVFSQNVGRKRPVQFKLRVRFYPKDVEELTDSASLRQLYMEVQQAVVTGSLQCPVEMATHLAAYSHQATDQSSDCNWTHINYRTQQWDITETQWKDQVVLLYEDLKDQMSTKSAMLEFLKLAQQLEGFGVSTYDIKTKKEKGLTLGISCVGMDVRYRESGENPALLFLWDDILSMAFSGKTFTVKMMQKMVPNFVFVVRRARINRQILALCIGYYELHIGRRQSTEKRRQERMSKVSCVEETNDVEDNGKERGADGNGAVFPGECGAFGGPEKGLVPLRELHAEMDGEKKEETEDEMSNTEECTSRLDEYAQSSSLDINQSEEDLVEYVLQEAGIWDEGESRGPPIPPKTYLLQMSPGEHDNSDWSETDMDPHCQPEMDCEVSNEPWVTFDDDNDVMYKEFESTQMPPPFVIVRHGSPDVAPVVGSEVTMLEVTPMSRTLCLAAITTAEDMEEYQPLRYTDGVSIVNTSVHPGAPLSKAEVHNMQILSFTKKLKQSRETDWNTIQSRRQTDQNPVQSGCQTDQNTVQSGCQTIRNPAHLGHRIPDNCEPIIREGNTKQRVMLFEAM